MIQVRAYCVTVRGAGVTVRGSRAWFKYSEGITGGGRGFNDPGKRRGIQAGISRERGAVLTRCVKSSCKACIYIL